MSKKQVKGVPFGPLIVDANRHGNAESNARIGVTVAWWFENRRVSSSRKSKIFERPRQRSGHADWTANLKLPTKRCGAVGIPPRSRVEGGQRYASDSDILSV